MGDEVFFRRDGAWHGPGTVIGSESSVVFVRNASRVLKVHASKLRHRHTDTGDSNLAHSKLDTTGNTSQEAPFLPNPIPVDDLDDSFTTDTGEPDVPNMSEVEAVTTSQVKLNLEVQPTPEPPTSSRNPKRGDRVKILSSTGEKFGAEVISRAVKANGKYKFHYNVQYDDPTYANECVILTPGDLNWKYDENALSESVLATMSVADEFADAREAELKSCKKLEVFDIVGDVGQPRIATRWVYTTKESGQ